MSIHTSVLVKEVLEYLDIKEGSKIIDATINGGGHTRAMLEKFQDIEILGIEWDPEIYKNLKIDDKRLRVINDSYVNLKNIVEKHDFSPDGILFDLGLSSWHYEHSGRGFSFKRDEPLDMRYNPSTGSGQAATEVVNTYSKEELEKIIREYGEEKFSKQIAESIVHARKQKPITTTGELVEVISDSVPFWYKKRKIHFATKTFQAFRIEVNAELKNVEKGVSSAIGVLGSGGRLAVISFHGLEDKIVRELFKKKAKEGVVKWVVKGTVKPKWEEIKNNPRARSAKMKIVEKLRN